MEAQPREVVILGSTGSIGTQALDIIRRNPDRFRVVALAAGGGQPDLLARQAAEFGPAAVAVASPSAAARVRAVHRRVRGVDPVTGAPYAAADPALLRWVHATEVASLLDAARRGGLALTEPEADRFLAEQVRAARLVGLEDVPTTRAALAESPWGTFTVGFTIPLALLMGLYMYRFRVGRIREASAIGVAGLFFAVIVGGWVADSAWASSFTFSKNTITILMAAYGFVASVLPVWMLLCPRDYLSSYLKIGTVAFLIIGVILVHPNLNMPAVTPFVAGGGPVIPGKVYPFVFITIACGAISGFHALIASGTTPKMIERETDARPIGYGGMLMEGVVGVVALIAATSLFPGDYFAINTAQGTPAPGTGSLYQRQFRSSGRPGRSARPAAASSESNFFCTTDPLAGAERPADG